MCGLRIGPDGRVVITTPSPGCCVGEVLYVIGSAAEFAVPHADWPERRDGTRANASGVPCRVRLVATCERDRADLESRRPQDSEKQWGRSRRLGPNRTR